MRRPDRKRGRNAQLERYALAHAQASAIFDELQLGLRTAFLPGVLPERSTLYNYWVKSTASIPAFSSVRAAFRQGTERVLH